MPCFQSHVGFASEWLCEAMSGLSAESRERLLTVLDAVCDQRAAAADIAELEQLVLSSGAAILIAPDARELRRAQPSPFSVDRADR